jgi:hypothetical protein
MCISNELCTEIAVALLATREDSNLDLAQLKEIVIEVHAVLQRMNQFERGTGDGRVGKRTNE